MARLTTEHETRWQTLQTEWENCIRPIHETIRAANATAEELFPDWQQPVWKQWALPEEFKNAAKFGRVEVDVKSSSASRPRTNAWPCPSRPVFPFPCCSNIRGKARSFLKPEKSGGDEAIAAINNIIFRLLSVHPPGKLSFTIFDPVGLGQNFAGLMHLADYEESHINSRIWTQTGQLEEKLAELNEHMEKVIQMYLRNEYETIAEYNAQAGTIAEKYHFLVIADFPVNFSETAVRRLINIATSGARCGVFTLIHWDRRHALPQGFVPDELRKNSVCLIRTENGFRLAADQPDGTRLLLDAPPKPEFVTDFLHLVGESGKDSNRVEVPFEQVAPPPAKIWTEETTDELRVPIGRSGATKLQYLAIGKGTRQHALIAGKTGSGKSTLFHVIITNLAMWCSPEQVEFYLVDFKKGVEFKCYATRRLPHARVVAIESDRAFGLSVLERVDAELRRRGDLFRELGVQDIAGYKKAGGTEPMPRSLLLIDEFQEYFTEEDRVSQGAAVLLDRIVRQGRAFGIHVLLGSQTLGGAYTLARATIGQMVIRIALMCNEADAYLIMDQDNPAPRLLSRPGEGIYNDAAGSIEGNSPFQTVWLPEEVRDGYLAKIRERADQGSKQYPEPFVFEGSAPADVRENIVKRIVEIFRWEIWERRRPAGKDKIRRRDAGAPRNKFGKTNSLVGAHLAGRAQFHQGTDRSGFPKAKRQQPFDCGSKRGNGADARGRRAGVAGRAISQGHRAFSPAGQHAARISATRISGARHPGHPARNHPGQTRRPGGNDGRFGEGNEESVGRRTAGQGAGDVSVDSRPAEFQETPDGGRVWFLLGRFRSRATRRRAAKSHQRRSQLRISCHRHLRHLQQREPFSGPEADGRIRDARALPDERQRFRQPD